jgi:hypothetical protein
LGDQFLILATPYDNPKNRRSAGFIEITLSNRQKTGVMKIFIAKGESEYKIYRVADHLIEDFKKEKQGRIVIEASSIQDALIQFSQLDKGCDLSFNPELINVKGGSKSAYSLKDPTWQNEIHDQMT